MANLRKSRLTALGLSITLMFFGQVMLCFADEVGLVPCTQIMSQNHRGSQSTTAGDMPITHCCHCTSHTSVLISDSEPLLGGEMQPGTFFGKADFVPESTAREIDHPPQLS